MGPANDKLTHSRREALRSRSRDTRSRTQRTQIRGCEARAARLGLGTVSALYPHMPNIRLMHAKLHRFAVTGANRDYVGSITIDANLLEHVGILPLEEVEIVNVDNGERWSTYVLPGARGSGVIAPNGGGALLCEPGHVLIVYAYETKTRSALLDSGHCARIAIGGADNRIVETRFQRLDPSPEGLAFDAGGVADPDAPSDAVSDRFAALDTAVAS